MRLLTASMRGSSSSGLRTGVEENRNCINRLNAAGTVQEKQANCKRLFRSAVPFRHGCHGRNKNVGHFSLTATLSYGRFEGILYLPKRREPLIQ